MARKEEENDENTKFKDGVNRNARLIVRNISFKATEDVLRDHFASYGSVEEVKLLKRPDGRLVGCGFVHYTHVPMANKALAATNKKPFLGRNIYVSWAVPKNKYTEEPQNDAPRKRTSSVLSNDEGEIPSKKEKTKQEVKNEEKNKQRVKRNARLIVRNISFKATEESLKEHFEPYGNVLEAKLLKKPDGKLVGCAFIHFKNIPMAQKALLNTNMKPFLGRPISVDWAVAKDKYMQHKVNQQLELEEDIKKEDSDSDDDDGPPLNIANDELKPEVKSESESDDEVKSEDDSADSEDDDDNDEKVKSDDEDSDVEDDDDDDGEEVDEEDDDEEENDGSDNEDDNQSQIDTDYEKKRVKLNDAEDGCTVFITGIPFEIDNDQLKDFAEKTGPVKYALVCVDKLTEHSKGSGFVKFLNQTDADTFLSLPPDQLKLEGQLVQVKPALKRENLQKGDKKQAKDNRNLYLVKEGVVVAGTKAAVGVSSSDMAKRLALERSKTQMLKNLNRFVSRYRLVVSNLPANCNDTTLRNICKTAAGSRAVITEARVMRDLRAAPDNVGRQPSKGYGFVMFMRHEDALACLRKLNNNPDIFDKNNRPIVSFSIEDRTALNARKKRLEKSIANNPIANKGEDDSSKKRKHRKRKLPQPDESYMKKSRIDRPDKLKQGNDSQGNFGMNNQGNFAKGKQGKFGNERQGKFGDNNNFKGKNQPGQFVRKPNDEDMDEYTGLTAKKGSQHNIRSNQKLRMQADLHKQNVKIEKKKSRHALRLKAARKERIKLPKQKVNKDKTKGRRRKKFTNSRNFNDVL